jgi:hypothetical protein
MFNFFKKKPPTDDDVLQGNILKNITSISDYVSSGFLKKVKTDLMGILDAIRSLKKDRDFYKKTAEVANEKSITPTQVAQRIDQMNDIHGQEMDDFNKELVKLRNQIIELNDANAELKQVNDDLKKNPGPNDDLKYERDALQQQIDILTPRVENQKGVVFQNCSEKLTVIDKKLSETVALFENYKNELDVIIRQIQTELDIEESTSSANPQKYMFQPPPPQRPPPQPPQVAPTLISNDNPFNGLDAQIRSNGQPPPPPGPSPQARGQPPPRQGQPPPPPGPSPQAKARGLFGDDDEDDAYLFAPKPKADSGFVETKSNTGGKKGGYYYSASNKINKKSIKSIKSSKHRKKHKGNKKTRR